jgi:hypothetical protein
MVAVTLAVAASIGAAIGGWYALEPSTDTIEAPVAAGAPLPSEGTGEAEQRPTAPQEPPPGGSATGTPEAGGDAVPPPAEPPEQAPAADAPDLSQLSAVEGYFRVEFPEPGEVYLNGVSQGSCSRWLKVKCGTWYVRVGDGKQVPTWLSAGRTVIVACGDATRRNFGPAAR